MGSSGEPEADAKGIDGSVGGLVWVRRRNGSWWPGRIMGLDELSENCLVSPRSGTPVKLLGREDASVDWYNLEKSKRVKAFRCGEYDECIEKAKISAANSNKKAVKYARREDAILHALELESARLREDRPDFCSRTDNSGGEHDNARESPAMFQSAEQSEDKSDKDSVSEQNLNSGPELSQSGISFEDPNHISALKAQSMLGRRRKTPNDSEDDGTEGTKRMKGLEDLGMGVASRKVIGVVPEVFQQDSLSLCNSNTRNCNGSAVNGDKVYCSSSKRKRCQLSNVQESLKRKNRRRPLTKVLESAAMVSVPVTCEQVPSISDSPLQGISDNKLSGIDSNDLKKFFSVPINNNLDSTQVSLENGVPLNGCEHACDTPQIHKNIKGNELSSISGLEQKDFSSTLFDVPFAGDDENPAGVSPMRMPEDGELGRLFSQTSQAEDVPLRNEGDNEFRSASLGAAHVNNVSETIEQGSSKWQSKGKRKSRNTSKNKKRDLRKYVDVVDELNADSAGIEHSDGFSLGSDQKVDCNAIGGSFPYGCPSQQKSKVVSSDQVDGFSDFSNHVSNRDPHTSVPTNEVALHPDSSPMPQRSLPFRQSRFTVPWRYQIPNVPIRNFCPESELFEVNLEVRANYRPQHVPLVSLMSKINGKAIVGHPLAVDVLNDGSCDLLTHSILGDPNDILEEAELVTTTKQLMLQPRSSPSKQPKIRKCEKIRKLSSLTGAHQQSEGERKSVLGKFEGPVIACIPLKLVFSRINEAVTGLARPTHRPSAHS